jgi:hypothetical protein
MTSPTRETADSGAKGEGITEEIARSLSSIWQRRTGERPSSVSAKLDGDVVNCAIEADDPPEDPSDASGYRQEACAAVTKIAHRRVAAYITGSDAKTGAATQKFIFERVRVKY